jgi:hypothetical protein
MGDVTTIETGVHPPKIDPVGVISEIINNITDERQVLRELLSNSAAMEVKAKHVWIRVYDSDKGLAFTVEDDGIGMDYTKSEEKPGRLDKFLNIAQGKQSGLSSDEFGAKGFGTKLLYNCKETTVESWDGGAFAYRVILNEPRKGILEEKRLVEPTVQKFPPYPGVNKGTKITVKGWNNRDSITRDFKLDSLTEYLQFQSAIGYTKARAIDLPQVTLRVGGSEKVLKQGFPYIVAPENEEDVRTVTFGPIEVTEKTVHGNPVKVVVKGGITLDTGKFGISDKTGGVWFAMNGVPYFRLQPSNKYSRRLGMSDDFTRFVAECDDMRLNLSRSDFAYDESVDAFESALDEAFEQIRRDRHFQTFYSNKRKEFMRESQVQMTKKKQEFLSKDKRFVWWNGRKLLAEPDSEEDTAALLWILEGAQGIPFAAFRTLQYPGYARGIDLLIDIQEEKESQMQVFVYAEVERRFSNLIRHGHDISQMTYAFCWEVDKAHVQIGKIDSTKKPYKYVYQLGGDHITVFELKSFPNVFVGTDSEAKDYYAKT